MHKFSDSPDHWTKNGINNNDNAFDIECVVKFGNKWTDKFEILNFKFQIFLSNKILFLFFTAWLLNRLLLLLRLFIRNIQHFQFKN